MDEKEKYEFNLHCACINLSNIEKKQGGLVNGNFSFHAKKSNVKVKDLRIAYEKYKSNS
jgi:hypothetical protein